MPDVCANSGLIVRADAISFKNDLPVVSWSISINHDRIWPLGDGWSGQLSQFSAFSNSLAILVSNLHTVIGTISAVPACSATTRKKAFEKRHLHLHDSPRPLEKSITLRAFACKPENSNS